MKNFNPTEITSETARLANLGCLTAFNKPLIELISDLEKLNDGRVLDKSEYEALVWAGRAVEQEAKARASASG